MKDKCVQAVTEAAGRALRAGESQDIVNRINRNFRALATQRRDEFMSMTPNQRLQEAAKMAAQELKANAAKEKQRVVQKIQAAQRIENYIKTQKSLGMKGFDALKHLLAFYADGKNRIQSVESRGNAIKADYMRQLLTTFETAGPKMFGLFSNTEGVKALVHELFGKDSREIVGAEAASHAKEAAKEWTRITDDMRKHFNNAGGEIGKLEDWKMPQNHSQYLVGKAGAKQWIADILPQLDRSRYVKEDGSLMSDAEMNTFLEKSWENIATGGANKADQKEGNFTGMLARRHAEERVLHFKDPEGYLNYQDKYADFDAYTTMVKHVERLSKDIAMLEVMGPNPDAMFTHFLNKEVAEAAKANPTKSKKALSEARSTQDLFDYMYGKSVPVANEHIARGFDTLRQWLVATRLGSSYITLLTHLGTMHITSSLNHIPSLQLFRNQLNTFNLFNQAEKRQAERAGLALQTYIGQINRFGADALGSNFSHKMANLTLRVSGFNATIEARRRAFGVSMYGAIGHTVKESEGLHALPEYDRKMLESRGTTETDFQVWKKAQLEDWGSGNKTMLTPDAIYRIPDKEIAKVIAPRLAEIEAKEGLDPTNVESLKQQAINDTKREAALKLLGQVLEEVNMAVVEPTAVNRAKMVQGLQRGTLKGELMNSFWLFKGYPFAVFSQHLMRGWNLPDASSKAAYLAAFIAGTTVLGAASMQANEVASGREVRNMLNSKFWVASLLKGGALGLYGDFLFNTNTNYMNSSPLAVMSGPVIGYLEDMIGLTQGNLVQMAQGKETHAGAEAVRFLKNNIPLQNLWYTKAVMDRMIFNQLQEYASPGYIDRVERRSRQIFQQDYWWHLKSRTPSHAPDLSKAIKP